MINYKELENLITKIFAEVDIMDLILVGCSQDEYSYEAKCVTKYIMLAEVLSMERIIEGIQEAFMKSFMTQIDMDLCEQIAECILENIEELRI